MDEYDDEYDLDGEEPGEYDDEMLSSRDMEFADAFGLLGQLPTLDDYSDMTTMTIARLTKQSRRRRL